MKITKMKPGYLIEIWTFRNSENHEPAYPYNLFLDNLEKFNSIFIKVIDFDNNLCEMLINTQIRKLNFFKDEDYQCISK